MKRMLALIAALALMCSFGALADGKLNVTGTGTVYMEADRVSVQMGVRLNGQDVALLQQQANETVKKICDSLENAGLDKKDISTANIYLYPQYDYSGEAEKIVGYTINNSLSVITSDIENIGNYIDIAFAAGANTFDSIQFSVKDDAAACKQALELAVKNAQEKAEIIAAASGKSLGGIEVISEGSQQDYYYAANDGMNVAYARAEATEGAATTVRAAQVSVSAKVEISYELE